VIGHTGTVNNVCPSGGGSFSMIGNGNSASWSASMAACDPILLPGQNCSASFTFTSGSLTLIWDGNTLTGSGTGTVTGCNLNNVTFSMTFDAVPSRP
jgi:hypothetical protein